MTSGLRSINIPLQSAKRLEAGLCQIEDVSLDGAISPEADWMSPEMECREIPAREVEPDCPKTHAKMKDIIADGRIDAAEAGSLYQHLLQYVGHDSRLDPGEIDVAALREAVMKYNTKIGEKAPSPDTQPLDAQSSRQLAVENLLREDERELALVRRRLNWIRDIVDQVIESTEETLRTTSGRDDPLLLRYLNFVSAENLLGLSGWITHDNTSFSHVEINGMESFLYDLYDYRLGIQASLRAIEKKRLPDNRHNYTRTFEDGPFGNLLCSITPGSLKEEAELIPASCDRRWFSKEPSATHIQRLIDLAHSHGAERLAHAIADQSAKDPSFNSEQQALLYSHLPGTTARFIDDEFTFFANSAVSLDSMALLLTGGVLGAALGKTAIGTRLGLTSWMLRVSTKSAARRMLFSGIRLAMPGTQIISTKATSRWGLKSLAAGAINLSFEIVRFNAWTSLAYHGIDPDTAPWVSRAYILVGSGLGAFATAWRSKLAGDIARLEPNAFADALTRKGTGDPAVRALLKDLSRSTGEARLTSMLKRRLTLLERADRRAASISRREAQLDLELAHIEQLAQEYGVILPEGLTGKVSAAVAAANGLKAQMEEVRRIFNESMRIIEQHQKKAMGSPTPPPKNRKSSAAARRPPWYRYLRKQEQAARETSPKIEATQPAGRPVNGKVASVDEPRTTTPGDTAASRGVKQPPISPLDRYAIQPPSELIADDILKLSGGKVAITEAAARKAILELYEKNPTIRKAFWRTVRQLAGGKLSGKRTTIQATGSKDVNAIFHTRLGEYRLFYRINNDGEVVLTSICKRGGCNIGGHKWSGS